ncbi:nitrite reductase large subunit NirB [Vibrio viridaestus]|uniref:Nitrite reductase small subunit NirD n=1 Tax=Vibrio viridaestus TaxID=2487322 RepID=A0A3N9TAM8_9VIBR|nr:nitrite reductase large subunit NirB [Vibrio viridaestus]RQW61099.1 nitrite reductase small subunit NirD [Vibrio viridaestus]
MNKPVLMIVGYGMVGHHFIEQLVAKDLHIKYQIILYGKERYLAYDRVHLTDYLAGSTAEDLSLGSNEFLEEHDITFHKSCSIINLNTENQYVEDSLGRRQRYDKLVLATGSSPFIPNIEGNTSKNCFSYRTFDDLDSILSASSSAQTGVVIGGGLLGLEAANALKKLNIETNVIEFSARLMAVQLDEVGGSMLRKKIEALGVGVFVSKETKSIVENSDGTLTLLFSDGSKLNSDIVVFSAGIRPNDQLAKLANIEVGERGGIVINDRCETSVPNVYAIGECALWQERIFGLVAPGYQMARILAANLASENITFDGADMSTKLKLMGVDVASFGDAHGKSLGCKVYQWINEPEEIYKKIVVSSDGKNLIGGVLVGDCDEYQSLLQIMLNNIPLPSNPEKLMLPTNIEQEDSDSGTVTLPESAQICSCHNVSKGDIFSAVESGCLDLPSVKKSTKAATGCGGCSGLVKRIIDEKLEVMGVEIKKDICAHFPYSRQELYHIIRIEEIKDFNTLLLRYGKGVGCEVCKPAIASILASCWNEYLLEPKHLPQQETNDRYFGNIQKNGTYSVVPRIPGGEITPSQLINIGEIAKQYNLYTKITGGQRIDLFGATLENLPSIWGALIALGFETGHAYGKSLRTVKSCVGSTWCRYGVQDSTSLAILLENRYKGLRSPHKIKMAVSGCTRECAEAQSKDIGVIATEKGWNLYVCGNGGMKPRHGELFASDIDKETLIKYIDRILMFYIRTADHLQRTSVWIDSLEGGIEYLRDIVINDILSISSTLEDEMSSVIDSYQCEWKKTLNSPEQLKLFCSSINDKHPDENIRWSIERNQIKPLVPSNTHSSMLPQKEWSPICGVDELPINAGVGALLGRHHIALFRYEEQVFAIDDCEPKSQSNVISRGILGDIEGEIVVISPIFKQRFRLKDGVDIDGQSQNLQIWPTMVENNTVYVANSPKSVAL